MIPAGAVRAWVVRGENIQANPFVACRIGLAGSTWASKAASMESASLPIPRQAVSKAASCGDNATPQWKQELRVGTDGFPAGAALELHYRVYADGMPPADGADTGACSAGRPFLGEATAAVGAASEDSGRGAEASLALAGGTGPAGATLRASWRRQKVRVPAVVVAEAAPAPAGAVLGTGDVSGGNSLLMYMSTDGELTTHEGTPATVPTTPAAARTPEEGGTPPDEQQGQAGYGNATITTGGGGTGERPLSAKEAGEQRRAAAAQTADLLWQAEQAAKAEALIVSSQDFERRVGMHLAEYLHQRTIDPDASITSSVPSDQPGSARARAGAHSHAPGQLSCAACDAIEGFADEVGLGTRRPGRGADVRRALDRCADLELRMKLLGTVTGAGDLSQSPLMENPKARRDFDRNTFSQIERARPGSSFVRNAPRFN